MLPQKLLDSLANVKGFNKESFERVHASGEQVTSVRLNPGKKVTGEWSMMNETEVLWCPHGRYLAKRPSFTLDPLLHGGAYYVQEASSMFLWHILEQTVGKKTAGLKVLDLCAAPGGKSTLLASYFADGLLVSNEVIKARCSILVENITKWGSDNVIVTNNDPKYFSELEGYFDVIVTDAPCSGSGLFRKDADAVNEWSEDNVILCSQRQQRILADIYPALKKDGILIYSTCSYSKEEDEDIVGWMSKTFPVSSFRLPVREEWNIVETISEEGAYGYRFYPDKVKGEGLFIAAFRKNEGEEKHHRIQPVPGISKNEMAMMKDWIKEDKDLFFFNQADSIMALPAEWKADLALLQKKLYLRKAGVTIGSVKAKDMVPDHELALCLLLSGGVRTIDVNRDIALQYLKRRDLLLDTNYKGWVALSFCGINIGWAKVLHNRVNNYYPVNWRILKD